jgi:lysophospholipase L1-like esterase
MKPIFLIIISFFFSCETSSQDIDNQKNTMSNGLSYLALGDSYTIGESVTENQRWPVQLTKSLTSNGIAFSQPQIIAKTGWTTDELKAKIVSENITKKYDLVSLLIGVNNQYRGRSVEEFRKQYVDLLETAIQFSGNRPQYVFVVSIPDWGVTPFGRNSPKKSISEQIDLFNAIKKEETEKRGILFVDITPISRQAIKDPSLIAEDGLHPSGKMYQLWTEKIVPELLRKIKP